MLCVPSKNGITSNLTLAAAYICGVDQVYNIGGAQAIAAFAHGTKTIKKADKVFGPGNQFVAEAKKQLFGTIGIDLPAGPSEVLVIANNKSNPNWIAYDVLAQAEHDPHAKTYVVSTSKILLERVKKEITLLVQNSKIQNIDQSIKNHCFLILSQGKKRFMKFLTSLPLNIFTFTQSFLKIY